MIPEWARARGWVSGLAWVLEWEKALGLESVSGSEKASGLVSEKASGSASEKASGLGSGLAKVLGSGSEMPSELVRMLVQEPSPWAAAWRWQTRLRPVWAEPSRW